MKVTDYIAENRFVTIVELLPPKKLNLDKLEKSVASLQPLCDFISLTSKKEAYACTSLDTAASLSVRHTVETKFLAHITIMEFGEIRELPFIRILGSSNFGIENFLVMRGDGEYHGGSYRYSSDLVRAIHDMNMGVDPYGRQCTPTDFCIGAVVSQYKNRDKELEIARVKRENGADFFITQMCFDPFWEGETNKYSYTQFRKDLHEFLGEDVPVIAGVPIPDRSTINFVKSKKGEDPMYFPGALEERLNSASEDQEERIKVAQEILVYLRDVAKAPGVDVFTIGKAKLARKVLDGVSVEKV
ncbi:MAG TPA: methylenetetrahydrofolate reductase [bacterium]|jgi:5,10-methylenetetrahydrofolate reductase